MEATGVYWKPVRNVLEGLFGLMLGAALGVLGCVALRRVLAAVLFGIGPTDPVTIAAAVGVLLLVTAVAAFFPALRAMRTDPMAALREE
jgi:ABC-type antimicrobial peptide transport system permease subunit